MINRNEIIDTIEDLESGEITLKTCNDLANLYIILEHIDKQDILPDSNVDETVEEIQTFALRYVLHRDLIDLNFLLNQIIKMISELYHTCESEKEKKEFAEFINHLSSVIQ